MSSCQELWKEITEEIDNHNHVANVLEDESNDVDNLHEEIGPRVEDTGKSENHASQALSCIAKPNNIKSKHLRSMHKLTLSIFFK